MSDSADIFAYITGAIALFMILYKALHSQLPSTKIKVLLEILEDAEVLLASAVNDGLVASGFVPVFSRTLADQKLQKDNLHAQVRCLPTIVDELFAMKRLSWTIFVACKDATDLRVEIATHSEKERARLGCSPESQPPPTERVGIATEQRPTPVAKDTSCSSLFVCMIGSLFSKLRDRSEAASFSTVRSRSVSPASTLVWAEEPRCSLDIALPPPCASIDRERGRNRCRA